MKTALPIIPFDSLEWNTTIDLYDLIVKNLKSKPGGTSLLVATLTFSFLILEIKKLRAEKLEEELVGSYDDKYIPEFVD